MIVVHAAIAYGLTYVSFTDLLYVETVTPGLAEAKELTEATHPQVPWQDAHLYVHARASLLT